MSPVTHFLTGWIVAGSTRLSRRDRAVITGSAVIADLDGIGIMTEFLTRHSSHPMPWFSQYHHALHTLLFGVLVTFVAFVVAKRCLFTAGLTFVAFHLHLLEDLVGSRGPDGFDWPIPYLEPFMSRWNWSWSGQWSLNAWPNFVLTLALVALTLRLAVTRGVSPVSLFSARADRAVISALRGRMRQTRCTSCN